ncbi:MAG: TetR/AcrR family transcriptional regulator, partial [Mycobacteriaceae bacterium]
MTETVKRRRYDSTRRTAESQHRRRRILDAAKDEFVALGYLGTTMTGIATRADVALDTVYTLVGRKPALFRTLIETAISGQDDAVPADQRDYVHAIQSEDTASAKLTIYAEAVRHIQARLAPLLAVLQHAAGTDDELAQLWSEISERRAANMRRLATDIADAAPLRVTIDEAADIIWATSSAELYLLLAHQRGWSPEHYQQWLTDSW